MKKREKIWKIIAVCCIGVGIIVSVSAMAAVGFDFTKFSSTKYELETCVVEEPFENIEIQTDWQDIRLLPSETPECKVVYAGNETLTYTVKVESGTLKINTEEHREWYQYLSNFNFGDYTDVTLYLPEKDYQSLSVSTSSGSVRGSLRSGKRFIVNTSSGDVSVPDDPSASQQCRITTGSGDVSFSE